MRGLRGWGASARQPCIVGPVSAAFHTTPGYSFHPAPRSDPDDDRDASTHPDTALRTYLARMEEDRKSVV